MIAGVRLPDSAADPAPAREPVAPRAAPDVPRATLYAFFATWCVPCRVELPHVQRVFNDYRARGLAVVLVSEDAPSTAQGVPAFLARLDVSAPWVVDDESELLERYNPSASLPFVVVLDARGRVAYAHGGYEPGDEALLEDAVAALLPPEPPAESPAAPPAASNRSTAAPITSTDAAAPRTAGVHVNSHSQGLGVYRSSRFREVGDDGVLRAAIARVEVAGYTERYRAAVRVDGALIGDAAGDDAAGDAAGDDRDAQFERAQVAARLGPVRLTAGDDYAAFGHGVSLSLRRVDPLGLDTSIRGGRADLDIGLGGQSARFTALGGVTNPQNLDPIELRVVDDVRDVITGAQLNLGLGGLGGLGGDSRAGPYAMHARARGAASDGGDIAWTVGGASATLHAGSLRFAADAAAGRREGRALAPETAWAGYGAAQWTRGRVTALVDAKFYRHWEIGRADRSLLYHEPPTLERDDQEVPANANAIGARTRVEVRLPAGAAAFANLLGYRYDAGEGDPLAGDLAVHGYAGAEKRLARGSASLQSGYRVERQSDGRDKLALWHVDLDAAWRLSRALAVTVKWNHREETKAVFGELSFRRGLAVIGVSRAGWGALSVLYGYSTESAVTPTHYPAGELLVHLPRGGSARLFVGELTGGRVCVSGSCRDVPPFQGARLDLIVRL